MERNKIIELYDASGMSVREFADKAGLKYSTAHDIVSGKTQMVNIGAGAFVRIAHVLGTTADALMADYGGGISADESRLLSLYREASAEGRARIMEQAEFLQARHPLNKAAELGA